MSVLTLNVNEVMRTLSAESSSPFVAHDKEVDIVRFAINSGFADIVLDGQVALRVMYQRPRETEVRAQTLTHYDTDGLHNYYDWQLSQSDLAKNGSLMVALCILDISGGEVSEWHTTPCEVRVLSTIHTDDSDEGDAEVTPTVKERVAVLESMIQRVASGAPIVVASTSAMTDTDQIYVLKTDGKWYYHNGTTWVAGGEYGAVSTDTTLTQSGVPADAAETGRQIDGLKADLGNKTDNAFAYCESGHFIIFSDYSESPVKFDVGTYNFHVLINRKNYVITPQSILDAATAAELTIEGTVISGTSLALYLDMSGSTPTVKVLKDIMNPASLAILTKNVVLFAGHFKSLRYGLFVDYQTQWKAENGLNKSTTNAENIAANTADIATNAENIKIALSAIDASIIPTYFEANLTAKIPLIIENMNTAGENGTTFVFITDIHWETNYRKSPALIKHILDKTSVKNVFCGGDIINQGQKADMYSVFLECINQYRYIPTNGFFPIARGNHDDNSNWSSSSDIATYEFDSNTIYNLLYSQVADKCVRFGQNWSFYYDDVTRKTRFVFADTKRNGAIIDTSQIVSVLNSVASGWHVILIMHFTLKSNTAFYDGCDVLAHIIRGYNDRQSGSYTGTYQSITYDFTNAVGTVDLIIGGHTHADYSMDSDDENNPSGVPIIATDTDSYRDHTGTEGTVNSQCFDVVTVDYTAKTVKCVRIGRGSDRTFSY